MGEPLLVNKQVFKPSDDYPDGRVLRLVVEPTGVRFREIVTDLDLKGRILVPEKRRLFDDWEGRPDDPSAGI